MTIEEAREYWSRRLERAANYSDEHWDAEERHAHKDYIDAMTHAITALAIIREREEAKQSETNGDRVRQMTDDELVELLNSAVCSYTEECLDSDCEICAWKWLEKEVSENAPD